MPRTFNPSPPEAGPGSAFARTSLSKKRSRRRSKAAPSSAKDKENKPKKSFIGEDLLDWHDENNEASEKHTKVVPSTEKTLFDKEEENNENLIAASLQASSAVTSRQAIALDTRFIETNAGLEVGTLVCQGYEGLLRSLVARGATPCLSVSTAPPDSDKASKKQSSIVLQSEDAEKLEGMLSEGTSLLSKVTFASNAKDGKRGKAVPVPKALSARWSWKVMANMVTSIVGDDKKKNDEPTNCRPLDITILTNDVSLFSDSNENSHTTAVDKFWDHIMRFFQDSSVGSIRIVMSQTGTVALQDDSREQDDDKDSDGDAFMDGDRDVSALKHNHETAVAKCIHAIQSQIAKRAEMDYKAELVEPSKGPPVNLSFSVIDNTPVGYQYLSRQWTRHAVVAQSLRSRLTFELPETLDGTQCSLSFDMKYLTLPFPAESTHTKHLFADLQHLAKSKTEIVQMVPLSSIDASLLFGVPVVLVAGLEDDFEQYQMMEVLVRSFFRILQERELAILLRSSTVKLGSQALFHSSEQTYLIMAQELPASVDQHPHSGILFPYAQANQLLTEASTSKVAPILDEDTENQLVEYVDRALDCLECNPVNPLYPEGGLSTLTSNGSSSAKSVMASDVSRDKNKPGSPADFSDDEWNDTTGVGSRSHLAMQEDEDGAAVEATEEENTKNEYT